MILDLSNQAFDFEYSAVTFRDLMMANDRMRRLSA
jgi:hypothetical protein